MCNLVHKVRFHGMVAAVIIINVSKPSRPIQFIELLDISTVRKESLYQVLPFAFGFIHHNRSIRMHLNVQDYMQSIAHKRASRSWL
jgi:hypothetical protein